MSLSGLFHAMNIHSAAVVIKCKQETTRGQVVCHKYEFGGIVLLTLH